MPLFKILWGPGEEYYPLLISGLARPSRHEVALHRRVSLGGSASHEQVMRKRRIEEEKWREVQPTQMAVQSAVNQSQVRREPVQIYHWLFTSSSDHFPNAWKFPMLLSTPITFKCVKKALEKGAVSSEHLEWCQRT